MISSTKLKEEILSDKYNSIIFDKGKRKNIYLVGGYIRDLLRGHHSQDRDYIVVGNVTSFIKKIRNSIRGTIITFKKGNVTRIAIKRGVTFDFSKSIGSIAEDLSKRDFTINAIAWSPHDGVIDLFHGLDDIKKRRISVIRKENFLFDPLRMLRAYRFAGEINGQIEKGTRQLIKIFNYNIKEIASERITLELFHLLNLNQSNKYLKMALNDGLLNNILFFSSKTLEHNIKEISLFEKHVFNQLPHTFKVELKEIISQNLTYKGLLCFALLMKNDFINGPIHHKIKLGNKIIRRINLIACNMKEKVIKGDSFDLYLNTEEALLDILILKNRIDCIKDYKRFKRIWNNGIISSEEIIYHSGIKSGKDIGKIIREIKRAEYEGRVKSKNSAIKLIKALKDNI